MTNFKEDYHKNSTDKIIDEAIKDLNRAKKQGIKKDNFSVTMFNIAHAAMKLNHQIEYIKSKYPEKYGDN